LGFFISKEESMSIKNIPKTWARELEDIPTDLAALAALVNDLKAKYNAAVTLINELKADLSEHIHTENTAGSYTQNADTAAGPAIAADDAAATAVADVAIKTS
jgi:pyruvate carboxylase